LPPAEMLSKPFRPLELANRVRRLFAPPAGPGAMIGSKVGHALACQPVAATERSDTRIGWRRASL